MTATAVRQQSAPRPVLGPVAAGATLAAGCIAMAAYDPRGGPTLCPFHAATGLWCPGCGATRALHALVTGHPGAAVGYNALFVLALPLLAWGVFASLATAYGGAVPRPHVSNRMGMVLLAVVLVWWVVRNLGFGPFPALAP